MTSDAIFEIITRHTCEVLPELESHRFKRDDELTELGANSLDRAEIVMMTLESLALNIPKVELHGIENIGQLADVLHQKSL